MILRLLRFRGNPVIRPVFLVLLLFGINTVYAQDIRAEYDCSTEMLVISKSISQPVWFDPGANDLPGYFFTERKGTGGEGTFFANGIMEGNCKEFQVPIKKSELPDKQKMVYNGWKQGESSGELARRYPFPHTASIDFVNCFDHPESGEETEISAGGKYATDARALTETQDNGLLFVWILGAVLLVIGFILFVYKISHRKSRPKEPLSDRSENGMIAVMEEEDHYESGLDHVRREMEHYYKVDVTEIFHDTAIRYIYISRTTVKGIYDFFKHFLEIPGRTHETGCYLIGCWEYTDLQKNRYDISLEYMIEPGDDAVYGEYNLNFGRKIGIKLGTEITRLHQKTKRDYVHNAWMHSHPGLGIFLSNNDLKVQEQLAYPDARNRMAAIVIDTNTPDWQTVFFTPKQNGRMNNKEDVLKSHSFDDIYIWSKEEPSGQNTFLDEGHYYIVQTENAAPCRIGFTVKSIHALEDLLYFNRKGIAGYFVAGAVNVNGIVVEDCCPDYVDGTSGYLIIEPGLSYQATLSRYSETIQNSRFTVIGRLENELMLVLNNPNAESEGDTAIFYLNRMKEWTRRKRVQ